MSDHLRDLMCAAQAGDKKAYRELLRELTPIVRRFVRRKRPGRDSADIEDTVQDTLLSLHSVLATYDPARPFLPWVYAIARNRAADAARQVAKQARHTVAGAPLPETNQAEPTNNKGETNADIARMRLVLAGLPEGQRKAVELVKLRELSLREASAITDSSETALKVSVHRAIKALRSKLRHEEQ